VKFEIIGKNTTITPAMQEHIEKKIRKLEKYVIIPEDVITRVLVRIYNDRQKIEVTIPAKFGILRAEASDFDAYAAVDAVVDKLEDQIRRQKTRLENRHRSSITENLMAIASEAEEEDIPVKTKDVYLEPITLDDAILQMELSGHNFYAYLDEESGEVCVVYRRYDGGYGVIETHTNH
jgi:putative sigma-54 modulation protein